MLIENLCNVKRTFSLNDHHILDKVHSLNQRIPKTVNLLKLALSGQISNHDTFLIVQTHKSWVIGRNAQPFSFTCILLVLVWIQVPYKESWVLEGSEEVLAVLAELTVDEWGGGAFEEFLAGEGELIVDWAGVVGDAAEEAALAAVGEVEDLWAIAGNFFFEFLGFEWEAENLMVALFNNKYEIAWE